MTEKLIEAIKHDSLVGVKKILENNKFDLNEIEVVCNEYDLDDPDEIPLLLWMAQSGVSIEMFDLLISHGLDLTWTNREGLGAIDIAIKHKRKDIVELCGKHGVSFTESKRKSGMTPLMVAASLGNQEMVEFFISHGARSDEQDRRGTDAVEYARLLGHTDLSEKLKK